MTAAYNSPAARLARAHREREASGWSWENNYSRRQAMIRLVLTVKGRNCHLCGLPGATTADHVIPRSRGGLNVLENLEPAHSGCNTARQDTPIDEWHATHPRAARTAPAPSREW